MPDKQSGRGGKGRNNKSGKKQLIDSLREACPAHKQSELDALVKSLKGDEEKIREKISEWWEEPVLAEEEWEDVNKKSLPNKKKPPIRGGRGSGRSGRGRGREGRGGRSDRREKNEKKDEKTTVAAERSDPGPAMNSAPRVPQGAWAKKTEAATPEPSQPVAPPPQPEPNQPNQPTPPPVKEIIPPTAPATPQVSTASSGSNVWATKGSAHLIRAEKPKPAPPIQQKINGSSRRKQRSAPAETTMVAPQDIPAPVPVPEGVTTAAPSSTRGLKGANAWSKDKSHPTAPTPTKPIGIVPVKNDPPKAAAGNVLNMGRWESGDADDNLDFGFGSFGPETSKSASIAEEAKTQEPVPSPARPPPGLSIGGMPPMPTNAVLVHELENKLEEVSVSKQQQPQDKSIAGLPPQQGPPGSSSAAQDGPTQQPSYPHGMGMYNNAPAAGYNAPGAAGNAFGGMGPSLAGNGPPHQQAPKGPQPPPPQGLYNNNSAPSSGSAPTPSASDQPQPSNANMPPGMQGMPYGNPMYYGQQQFHMGQHQPGIGYNYGYGGQFAGGGGFGYGMNAGYAGHGGPQQYDEHSNSNSSNNNYPKNNYRGNRGGNNNSNYQNHHQNPHHQNAHHQNAHHYNNPQQPYGGQPYNMGYHGEHFSQRGGYGNMQDPYGMQQQQGGGNYGGGGGAGFQGGDNNNDYKGKKGGGRLNQFQGQPQQQPFGFQQQESSNQPSGDSNSGWPQQGGWSAAASGWQGK